MTFLRVARSLLLLAILPACGNQLVEFPLPILADDAGRVDAMPVVDAPPILDARAQPDAFVPPDALVPVDAFIHTDAFQPPDARIIPDGFIPPDALPVPPDARIIVDAPVVLPVDAFEPPDARIIPDAVILPDAFQNPDARVPVDARPIPDVRTLLDAIMIPDAAIPDAAIPDALIRLSPMVISTQPTNGALNVAVNTLISATFNEGMDPTTLNGQTFTVKQGTVAISGVVTYDSLSETAAFTPSAYLDVGLVYAATVTIGAKDPAGTSLASDYVWTFTTGACSLTPVALGSAGTFVVLAGSTVTNTGPTSVTGDLGVSPGTAVTGFPPGTIIGAQHDGDPTAAQAIADMTIAYNDTAGRSLCPIGVAGNLGGMTLAPGLYKSTSSLAVSSGDLTLDAQGDPDAVFIFQMASTMTTTPGRMVILAGGAKSANIYWQVGTSATLGTNSVMEGTVMADQSITMNTGATINGRVLARVAAVSLDSNTIVKPAP